jgi:hypothetical protein
VDDDEGNSSAAARRASYHVEERDAHAKLAAAAYWQIAMRKRRLYREESERHASEEGIRPHKAVSA